MDSLAASINKLTTILSVKLGGNDGKKSNLIKSSPGDTN
jgi:hypothetical protein